MNSTDSQSPGPPAEPDEYYMVGFRLDREVDEASVYAIYVNCDRPVMDDDLIVFFTRPEDAIDYLENSGLRDGAEQIRKDGVATVFDVPMTMYLASQGSLDEHCDIIDLLNVLFDFEKAVDYRVPEQYSRPLKDFADHMTFSKSVSEFFEQTEVTRKTIVDGLLLYIGNTVSVARIIKPIDKSATR